MTKEILFAAIPFDKNLVTLALESGVDGIIVEPEQAEGVRSLGRCQVLTPEEVAYVDLQSKDDEQEAVDLLQAGQKVILKKGWEIIPVENILAQVKTLGVEVADLDQARLAAGVLEIGVQTVVVLPEGASELKEIVAELKVSQGKVDLEVATVTQVRSVGLGHRVCVDTMTLLKKGEGMLIGDSSAFMFLVHGETESNPYVAPRPFRINAGAVHAYVRTPGDKTAYLEEIKSGREVLLVGADGSSRLAIVGRAKVEIRPMLMISAKCGDKQGHIFLQNAETIRVVRTDGSSLSVVKLREGDEILCRTDQAGRHFGMRIEEEIEED